MAMPLGSMIEKFRPEFEAHMEAARRASEAELAAEGELELAGSVEGNAA